MNRKLLSRDDFKEAVFLRDGGRCIVCGSPGVDAHHLIERKFWDDGGYYIDNGVTLCSDDHLKAEQTILSPCELRELAGVKCTLLPGGFSAEYDYDKWGNVVLPNGTRVKGEVFHLDNVQKILSSGGVLDLFVDEVKYPRTYHLPWSPGLTNDDHSMKDTDVFVGREVIVLEKMDGENTTIMNNNIHARSVDSKNHPSRNWVKGWAADWQHEIPAGWKLRGENMFAKHSIFYDDLESYFLGFAIWDDKNTCLSWDETVGYFNILGIKTPRVIYRGFWDERLINGLSKDMDFDKEEGYVVRVTDSFFFTHFNESIAKFVRPGHVQTDSRWMNAEVVPNQLKTQK